MCDLVANGFTIGAHGVSHKSLAQIPLEDAQREVMDSKRLIQEKTGAEVDAFAYPFGTGMDYNDKVKQCVEKAGYRAALTAVNGANDHHTHIYELRRTKVEGRDSFATFRRLLHGGMDPWMIVDRFASWIQTSRAPIGNETAEGFNESNDRR